jgi:ABC-type multidrug transport system fused ATPase/permease subunit
MLIFKKLLFLLSPHERKSAALLLVMMIIMALLDMVGVASILPFITVLMNPNLIETNIILNNIFQASRIFGIDTNQEFIFFLGIAAFVLLIISIFFKALTTYAQVRFVQMREYSIGRRLIEVYLHQPYSWFLNHHSADLGKNILSEVGHVIGSGMYPLIELLSKSIVIIAIVILLIVVDPKLAIIVSLSLSSCYCLSFYFVSKYLKQIGEERLNQNNLRFKSVAEVFGAIKEIKISGLEKVYIKSFSDSSIIFSQIQASAQIIAQLPRFILEAIAFGGILLILLYIIFLKGSFNSAIPIVSLYVFAGYRLIPALQQVYASLTQMSFVGPSLDKIYNDIKNLKLLHKNQNQVLLSLNKKIVLKDIHFNYPNSQRIAVKNINLTINAKSTVGFVGATGSGKTTMADIILGLLETQKGTIEIDGKAINQQNLRSWQSSIGYVPQHIYLTDDTVAANIAFGQDTKNINLSTVEKVCKITNLHDFIINDLPKSYQTTIGERGVRLSGGQRQRIGIARALYYNPQLLILDEATSALDNQTEKFVMDAINNLNKYVTIILIAHRLNTVKNCDKIFFFSKGGLKDQGNFDELKNKYQFFEI